MLNARKRLGRVHIDVEQNPLSSNVCSTLGSVLVGFTRMTSTRSSTRMEVLNARKRLGRVHVAAPSTQTVNGAGAQRSEASWSGSRAASSSRSLTFEAVLNARKRLGRVHEVHIFGDYYSYKCSTLGSVLVGFTKNLEARTGQRGPCSTLGSVLVGFTMDNLDRWSVSRVLNARKRLGRVHAFRPRPTFSRPSGNDRLKRAHPGAK